MKRLTHRRASGPAAACVAAALALGASQASAQGAPPAPAGPAPAVPPATAAPVAPPTSVAPAPVTPVAPAAPAAPVTTTPMTAAPVAPAGEAPEAPAAPLAPVAGEAPAAPAEAAAAEPPKDPWYNSLEISAFVDSYFSLNLNFPKPQGGTNQLRGPDANNGFSLAQVGVGAVYEADPVGATIFLRFGPQALAYAGYDVTGYGLEYLRQGFVTWKPSEKFTFEFGKWDTFAGAEGNDSQDNFTYTRGLVHWLAQPTFHTGLRATYTPFEELGVQLFVANGLNRTIDNNVGKTFGLQVRATPSEALSASVGYIVGPEEDDTFTVVAPDGSEETRSLGSANKRMTHIIDLIVSYDATESLSLLLNADLGLAQVLKDELSNETVYNKWFGVALAGRYAINDAFAASGRVELYKDPDAYTTGFANTETGDPADVTLASGTLSVEAMPSPHLIIKLDGRFDWANGDYFQQAAGYSPTGASAADDNRTSIQPTITLGVVAKTN